MALPIKLLLLKPLLSSLSKKKLSFAHLLIKDSDKSSPVMIIKLNDDNTHTPHNKIALQKRHTKARATFHQCSGTLMEIKLIKRAD